MNEQALTKHSLDDVMMAMDVVDTLRHRSRLVEKELGTEDRDEELKQKLRKIYAAQGIEVPDHVLEEGVKALRDGRFSYQPPAEGLQVKLARIYVRRAIWGKWVFGGIATLILAVASYYFLVIAPSTMLPEKVQKIHQAVQQAAKIDESQGRTMADELFAAAKAALENGDEAKAKQLLGSMEALKAQLQAAYRLQIVVAPQAKTGVWRIPDANTNARNYYIIVEAVGPDGNPVEVPIKNEETGKTDFVTTWGLRVDEKVFNRIAKDKQDDGIVQDREFGVKQSGYLNPEYRIPTTGAAITSW
jgi:polyhydroxyalkanoate synthesis regulator phasin